MTEKQKMNFKLFNEAKTDENKLSEFIEKMKRFAVKEDVKYKNYLDYVAICDWVIRRQEYNFIIAEIDTFVESLTKPAKILDVGCGVVPLCNRFSHLGHDVVACDPLSDDIQFLNSYDMNNVYGSRVRYLNTGGEVLPFEDESFDVVYAASVFEHIPSGNDRLTIVEMLRVLKRGGLFVFTTDVVPNDNSEKRKYGEAFDVNSFKSILTIFKEFTDMEQVVLDEIDDVFKALDWEMVFSFWEETFGIDNRVQKHRHYLAIGISFLKNSSATPLCCDEKIALLMEGQSAIVSAYDTIFSSYVQKEQIIQQKEQALHELSKSLQEKEAVIQELDTYIKKNIRNIK